MFCRCSSPVPGAVSSPVLSIPFLRYIPYIHTATTSEIPPREATSDHDPSPPAFAKQAQSITDRVLPCPALRYPELHTVLSLALEQHIHPRHQGPHNTRQPNTTRRSTITSSCQHLRAHTQSPHSPANSRCNGCRRARYARPPYLHPIAHCPPAHSLVERVKKQRCSCFTPADPARSTHLTSLLRPNHCYTTPRVPPTTSAITDIS